MWARGVRLTSQVLITDTTLRDAHQSLLATRVRTEDIVHGAALASKFLGRAFSLECWGGATFDVAYRFLHEDPWERLREIRKAAPNVLTQMLVRGANAVGYTSYPDNVVEEFVKLAAANGMDVFRIFDCFNDPEQMRVCVDAVRKHTRKVAEVCICYTADIRTSEIYNVEYYKDLTRRIVEMGAHIIAIKARPPSAAVVVLCTVGGTPIAQDMAGLLKPQSARLLVETIRSVRCGLPWQGPAAHGPHPTAPSSRACRRRGLRCATIR